MTRVVLGSASSGRLKVLRQAGIDPVVVVSGVDEDALIASLNPAAPPGQVVRTLATAKAADVVARLPAGLSSDCVVIGCDSMLEIDGRLCGKPGSAAAALEQWRSMVGRCGVLHTGHCLVQVRGGDVVRQESEASSTTVHFGVPEPDDLQTYVENGEPVQVAGAFTLDGLGGWFVDSIEGDPSSVIGVSLPLVRRLLQRCGITVASIWAANPVR